MEARIAQGNVGVNEDLYQTFFEEQNLTKQTIIELKYEITDLRKETQYELSQLKSYYEHNIQQSLKDLEMRMYHFITKAVMTTIGVLGGLQSFFHFFK